MTPGLDDGSGAFAPGTPQGDDGLAAEYVLGVFDLPDRLAFEARLKVEPILRFRVESWQNRLAPLNDAYPEIPAPALLPVIEARLFGPQRRARTRFWAGLFGGAVAAVLALGVGLSQLAPPPGVAPLTATLAAAAQPLVFAAAYDPATQILRVSRTAGTAAAPGTDYQLWLIGASGVPEPITLLRAVDVAERVPGIAAGVTLAVSLEASGGSTTGAPALVLVTGPVTET